MASPQTPFTLRARHPTDTPTLHDILTRVHTASGYPVDGPTSFTAFLDPAPESILHSVVASLAHVNPALDGQIVGSATLMRPTADLSSFASRVYVTERGGTVDGHAILSKFFVDPAVNGKGVGRAMLRECLEWGAREGRRVVLVVLEKDGVAKKMYEREGFVGCGETVYVSKLGVRHRCFGYLGPEVGDGSGGDDGLGSC